MGAPLYEIAAQYRAVMAQLENSDFDAQTIADTLEGEQGDLIDKLASVIAVMLNLEAEADAVKAAKERMAAREKSLRSRVDWLRQYAITTMQATNIPEVNTPEFVAKVRKGGESLAVTDEAALVVWARADTVREEAYLRMVPSTFVVDKEAVKAAINEGVEVPGAQIRVSHRLAIK